MLWICFTFSIFSNSIELEFEMVVANFRSSIPSIQTEIEVDVGRVHNTDNYWKLTYSGKGLFSDSISLPILNKWKLVKQEAEAKNNFYCLFSSSLEDLRHTLKHYCKFVIWTNHGLNCPAQIQILEK